MMGPGLFRLCLAFVVVVHHSAPIRLGPWAVDLFFAISGYWIAVKCGGIFWNAEALIRFWSSRWWRIAPLFLLCSLLVWTIARAGWTPGVLPESTAAWWLRQLPVVAATSAGRILPVTWTLDVEMQFYLAAPLLVGLWTRLSRLAAAAFTVGSLAWGAYLIHRGSPMDAARLDVHLGFFLIGFWLRSHPWRPAVGVAWVSLVATVVGFAGVVAFPESRAWIWRQGAPSGPVSSPNSPLGCWVVAAAGALLSLPFLARNLGEPSEKLDRWLGQLAFPLFLFHWIPRDIYYQLVDWEQPWTGNAILWLAQALAALIGAVLLWFLVDQPSETLRRHVLRDTLPGPQPRP